MSNSYTPMQAEGIYHIYSRAIGHERLFLEEDNYRFFLDKYRRHIQPVAETFAWCLLPNHFHFLIKIKSFDTVAEYYKLIKGKEDFPAELESDFIMERFSNWLNSYTKAFNKVHSRKGGLFIDYMKRIPVRKDAQFGATIFYVHENPVHHGLVRSISDWHWSSYKSFLSKNETSLLRDYVLQWFQGVEALKAFHQQPIYLKDAVQVED